MSINKNKSIRKGFTLSKKRCPLILALCSGLFIQLLGCNTNQVNNMFTKTSPIPPSYTPICSDPTPGIIEKRIDDFITSETDYKNLYMYIQDGVNSFKVIDPKNICMYIEDRVIKYKVTDPKNMHINQEMIKIASIQSDPGPSTKFRITDDIITNHDDLATRKAAITKSLTEVQRELNNYKLLGEITFTPDQISELLLKSPSEELTWNISDKNIATALDLLYQSCIPSILRDQIVQLLRETNEVLCNNSDKLLSDSVYEHCLRSCEDSLTYLNTFNNYSINEATKPLETHAPIDVKQKETFQCRQCLKIFTSQAGFLAHNYAKHEGKIYACPECFKTSLYNSSLNLHKKTKHASKQNRPKQLTARKPDSSSSKSKHKKQTK